MWLPIDSNIDLFQSLCEAQTVEKMKFDEVALIVGQIEAGIEHFGLAYHEVIDRRKRR